MGDIKLVYFNFRGRAEAMRLAFAAAGKKYENVVINYPSAEWEAEKKNTPYGLLPMLVVNGKKYGESNAIGSYVARECGLAGKTSEDAMRVDECFSLADDLMKSIGKAQFEQDEKKKADDNKKLQAETIPRFLGYFEGHIKENGCTGFIVGDSLSFADLAVYDIVQSAVSVKADALASCPGIQKLRENVEANPRVKAYLATRENYPL